MRSTIAVLVCRTGLSVRNEPLRRKMTMPDVVSDGIDLSDVCGGRKNIKEEDGVMSKVLIVYYSRKGENYWNGSIRNLTKGNTEIVAEMIRDAVAGELFEVDTVKTYASDYNACTEEAKLELRSNTRPELKKYLDSIDAYDTIFVGYPNWWGTMPMAMFTFLEHYDLSGKKIIPFCTNEGSGMGVSERDLKKLCPGATIEKGLAIHGAEAAASESKVSSWAEKMV